jgi:hypothetical protein
MKEPVVREQLEKLRAPVLWVDTDGEIIQPLQNHRPALAGTGGNHPYIASSSAVTVSSPRAHERLIED